jgi:hypothetical protein
METIMKLATMTLILGIAASCASTAMGQKDAPPAPPAAPAAPAAPAPPALPAPPTPPAQPAPRFGGGGFGTSDGGWTIFKPTMTRETERGAYLGISVTSVPAVLRDQLKLQKNMGLVVNFVEKGSPAEAAGIKQSDILQKLDDQLLVNAQQFAVLVRGHDVNQPVRFTLIRETKPMEVTAKAEQRDLPVLDESGSSPFKVFKFDGVNQLPFSTMKGRATGFESKDPQHTHSISEVDGHRTLKATDKNGKLIYDGPIDTDEQMGKLPEEIRTKVKNLPMLKAGATTQPGKRAVDAARELYIESSQRLMDQQRRELEQEQRHQEQQHRQLQQQTGQRD